MVLRWLQKKEHLRDTVNRSNIETLGPEWIENYKGNWGKREWWRLHMDLILDDATKPTFNLL